MIFQLFACLSISNAEALCAFQSVKKPLPREGQRLAFYTYRELNYLRPVRAA